MTLQLHLWPLHLWPIMSILCGILVLVQPKLAHYAIAAFLILLGVFGPGGFIR